MRKLLKFLTSRVVVISFLILLQLLFFVILIFFLVENVFVFGLFQFSAYALVIYILSKHDNPTYKIAWIIPVLAFPIFGGFFYFLFGKRNISKKFTAKINSLLTETDDYIKENYDDNIKVIKKENPVAAKQVHYIRDKAFAPIHINTYSEYLSPGEEVYKTMIEELEKAEKFIFMEYFIIEPGKMWDKIEGILIRKAKLGVKIRLMYDDLGCIMTLPKARIKHLEENGIITRAFNLFKPSLDVFMNYRDHRKICVIDGNIGFTGGINLADEYINQYEKYGHWKDACIMLKGDAVFNLTMMFLQLWGHTNTKVLLKYDEYKPTEKYETDGYVQPFGDNPIDDDLVGETTYMNIINSATNYIYICTPYLILDNEMITSLTIASQSGVDVRIITPFIGDKWYVHTVTRSYYKRLIEAGVKIFEYKPGFIHSKLVISDDMYSIVGTTNFDFRSFYLHFECGVFLYKASCIKNIYSDFIETQQLSREVTLQECINVNFVTRVMRALIGVFSPLM